MLSATYMNPESWPRYMGLLRCVLSQAGVVYSPNTSTAVPVAKLESYFPMICPAELASMTESSSAAIPDTVSIFSKKV
ncbi:MAG: hypothetical protein ACD_47C00211G0002 [uncultured bacterium]|nr:MAG: hypothetical protein ACD_47C00211G0002 [uncultured bacterium]